MRPEPLRLSPDEEALLRLAEESENFIVLPLWKKIEAFLRANVEEALDSMRGNISHDPMVHMRLQLIWREREQLRDSLVAFVKAPIKDRKELLEQIEELRSQVYGPTGTAEHPTVSRAS